MTDVFPKIKDIYREASNLKEEPGFKKARSSASATFSP